MKTAGIARAVVLATTLTLVGTMLAASAGAAPLSKQINLYSDELAVDGTDIYSTITRKSKGKRATVIYRSSFLNKSRTEIARFPGVSSDDIADFHAGGGVVVVSLTEDVTGSSPSKSFLASQVLRIARDGSRRDVIATGRIESGPAGDTSTENGSVRLTDCGTRVRALGVSAAGSVAIASLTGERRSKSCGRKQDVDHWRFYEQRLDGSQREILVKDRKVSFTYKVRGKSTTVFNSNAGDPVVDGIELVGDRALIRSSSTRRYSVRDLATGALTGPFGPAGGRGKRFSIGSLSSTGSLAMNTFSFAKSSFKRERIGVFPRVSDPSNFLERKSEGPLTFCGSHLLSIPTDVGGKLQEVDPVTFATKRVIASKVPTGVITFGLDLGCDENFTYAINLDFGDVADFKLLAYPLN